MWHWSYANLAFTCVLSCVVCAAGVVVGRRTEASVRNHIYKVAYMVRLLTSLQRGFACVPCASGWP